MMLVTWPGIVLVLLVGTLLGAGVAFWKARTWRDVARFVILGILGFALGQGLTAIAPFPLGNIGGVNIVYGSLSAGVILYLGVRWAVFRLPF